MHGFFSVLYVWDFSWKKCIWIATTDTFFHEKSQTYRWTERVISLILLLLLVTRICHDVLFMCTRESAKRFHKFERKEESPFNSVLFVLITLCAFYVYGDLIDIFNRFETKNDVNVFIVEQRCRTDYIFGIKLRPG